MIPKVVHHIWIQRDLAFGLVHYLCVRSAKQMINPEKTIMHVVGNPAGEWWDKMLADVVPQVVQEKPVDKIGDFKFTPPVAIQSGPLRLRILAEQGGIYLDTDVICLKSFDPLLNSKVVLGLEAVENGMVGLCNAVMLSEPNAEFTVEFLRRFEAEYKGGWGETCTILPWRIACEHPEWITVLPPTAFYPYQYGAGLKLIFEQHGALGNAYAIHLWSSGSFFRYLDGLTENDITKDNTTFTVAARQFLPLPKPVSP